MALDVGRTMDGNGLCFLRIERVNSWAFFSFSFLLLPLFLLSMLCLVFARRFVSLLVPPRPFDQRIVNTSRNTRICRLPRNPMWDPPGPALGNVVLSIPGFFSPSASPSQMLHHLPPFLRFADGRCALCRAVRDVVSGMEKRILYMSICCLSLLLVAEAVIPLLLFSIQVFRRASSR